MSFGIEDETTCMYCFKLYFISKSDARANRIFCSRQHEIQDHLKYIKIKKEEKQNEP